LKSTAAWPGASKHKITNGCINGHPLKKAREGGKVGFVFTLYLSRLSP